jgi:Ser/Thr protein kinase RdoA (MazF antagonist)
MMDVQRMRHIVDEVVQGALPDVVQSAALRWCGPGELNSLTYVRSSSNHLFRFLRDGHLCYLRLSHSAERHQAALEAELDFVHHVARTGLAVARPVASAHGLLIEDVSTRGQSYWAVVFEGLQGRQLEFDELDEAGYRACGHALALVHRASQTFPSHQARPEWHAELRAAMDALPAEETIVAHILASGLRWLDTLSLPVQDYGLLHGDFELDNLIWNGEQVQALDFDDAAYAWYVVDFAAALQDVWLASDPSSELSQERLTWFTQGYAAVRPLPDGLPETFSRAFALVLAFKVARVLRAYATTSDGTNPPWLAQMRAAHQQWLRAKRATLRRTAPIWD